MAKHQNFEIKRPKENEKLNAMFSCTNNKENLMPKRIASHSYSKNYQKKLELLEKNCKKSSCRSLNLANTIPKSETMFLFINKFLN